MIKPFVKWAGGKTQLLTIIDNNLPSNVSNEKFVYIEPFVGGGAMLFHMLEKHPNIDRAIINDINEDLMNCYQVIKDSPDELIQLLSMLESTYHAIDGNVDAKNSYYYANRSLFNERKLNKINQAALFIFLNKTCFNGLYRVNKNNMFNVPTGKYKKPTICDRENILAVSKALQKVVILCGDYTETVEYVRRNTLFYFDPPYKPISETSKFTSYSKDNFSDFEQVRLHKFIHEMFNCGKNVLLSNSDTGNDYFDKLYDGFNIQRIEAKRSINSKGNKRGKISELLIKNY